MTLDQLLVLLATLSAPHAESGAFTQLKAGGFDRAVPVTIRACPQPIAPEEIEGETILCGTVAVPENHAEPDGRTIDLLFSILKAHSSYPEPDPVVHLHGGPGGSVVGSLEGYAFLFEPWRRRRDIVLFDQRAAGLSSFSVTCSRALNANIIDLALQRGVDDPVQGEAGLEPSPLLRDCLAELQAADVDIASYNTTQNAYDVRSIVNALGYHTYNLYGISYGTKLSLEVMRSAPEGLRSVIIDGVAPPAVRLYDTLAVPLDEAMVALVAECAADASCDAAYPDLGGVLHEVLRKAAAGELQVAGHPVSVADVLTPIMIRNGQFMSASLTPYLPAFIYELHRGQETPTVDRLVAANFILPKPGEAEALATAAAAGLTAEQQTMVDMAVADIAIAGKANASLRETIQQLKESVAGSEVRGPLAALFDRELGRAALDVATADKTVARALVVDYVALQSVVPSKDVLIGFVDAHFVGEARDRLLALVAAMTGSEVAASFDIIRFDAYKYQSAFQGTVDLFLYACQEDMPFNSPEGFERLSAGLVFPEVAAVYAGAAAGLYANCAIFPPAERPGFHAPVVSDIPTLAIGSAWDTQTAASWAALAVSTLSHGHSVIIPEAGHGALLYQQCAKDMGVAFIDDPERVFDDSCEAGARPQFHIAPWVAAGN